MTDIRAGAAAVAIKRLKCVAEHVTARLLLYTALYVKHRLEWEIWLYLAWLTRSTVWLETPVGVGHCIFVSKLCTKNRV